MPEKLIDLTEDTSPSLSDLIYTTKDPSGTPLDRKVQIINLLGKIPVSIFVSGTYEASQRLIGTIIPISCLLPSGLIGSTGKVFEASATASSEFSLKKNGTEFGTLTVGTDDSLTYAAASSVSFNGTTDYLEIIAPSSPDSTLAGINIILLITRS